ncbi:MAG: ribbon-helix-helix protein, CopG family [Candidatus Acidiferrum sp.]
MSFSVVSEWPLKIPPLASHKPRFWLVTATLRMVREGSTPPDPAYPPNCRIVIQGNMCYRSGIMGNNEKTISFRAVTEKINALDSLAAAQDRSRSYLINEAIANYIELHAYQDALVRKGLEEKRKGRVLSHEEVVKGLKRTGRAR